VAAAAKACDAGHGDRAELSVAAEIWVEVVAEYLAALACFDAVYLVPVAN
jgi:hypothetical protein